MARSDEEPPWSRQVWVGLAALVATSLLVGGVVALVALGAARGTGLADDSRAVAPAEPSLVIPSDEPTTEPDAFPDPPGADGGEESASPSASPSDEQTRPPRPLRLQASPTQVAEGERINLTGTYRRGEGATLQVQRFSGGWSDFPVTVTVSDGEFATYIFSGQTGQNRFRVVDVASGRASNPVRVTIG